MVRAVTGAFLDAVLWLARSGARWRDLPEDRFGPYQRAKRRYYRWIEAGVFDRIFEAVSADPDLEWASIDVTVIRANAFFQKIASVGIPMSGEA